MLRKYAICDPSVDGQSVATLYYDTDKKSFRISIDEAADVGKLPLSLKMHATLGRYDLNEDFSMDWVRSRICPPSRHNISTILQVTGLHEYDEYGLISYTKGISVMDDLYLVANLL